MPWEDAAHTFMAVDVHGRDANVFWVGVRSFALNGDSRLIHYSREVSWQSVDQIREKFAIKPWLVGVDSGYATFDVYAHCAKYGYTAWKGEGLTNDSGYAHNVRGRIIRRPWSVAVRVDVKDGSGKKVTLFRHANNLVKSALHRCRTGRTMSKWLVGSVGEYTSFYLSQIDGEVLKNVTQKRTGKPILRWVKATEEQHAVDVEAMILCMAMMAGLPIIGARKEAGD